MLIEWLLLACFAPPSPPRTDALATCLTAEASAWSFPPGIAVEGVRLGIQT